MHFRHISAKIQPKNLKQHFDSGEGRGLGPPSGYALAWGQKYFCAPTNKKQMIEVNNKCKSVEAKAEYF